MYSKPKLINSLWSQHMNEHRKTDLDAIILRNQRSTDVTDAMNEILNIKPLLSNMTNQQVLSRYSDNKSNISSI